MTRWRLLAYPLIVVATLLPGSPATAAGTENLLLGKLDQPAGVIDNPAPASVPRTGAAAGLGLRSPEGEGGGYGCNLYLDHDFGDVEEDDYLEETVDVDYFGEVECNFYLAAMSGVAGVLDRSDSFNGQSFDGRVVHQGIPFYAEWEYKAYSSGSTKIKAREYNGGRRVEPAFELYLQAPEGLPWEACNPVPGLRYLICEGLGTELLHVAVGTGGLNSGLTRTCRDQTASLDPEQARLTTNSGTKPASTQILRQIASIKDKVVAFKRDLCTQTGDVSTFVNSRGQQLWDGAVTEAKNNAAQGDDRPLYWARVSMTAALTQRRPAYSNVNDLRKTLEETSRGMRSHDFAGTGRKVFISGFDPFSLSSILRGNPSGAAVLRLDGSIVAGAEVQAVIFPVRYADFDAGMVEDVFARHVNPGSQQATLITTVSQGSAGFDLEFYNGRRRSSDPFQDNRGELSGGTLSNPVVPGGLGAGKEFIQTTLPVDQMKVGSNYPVVVSTEVREKVTAGAATTYRSDGPTVGAAIAVEGSGSGFLSNEIAYRATRLRDAAGVNVPAGHVHVPALSVPSSVPDSGFDAERNRIASQYRQILEAGINNAGTRPVTLRADRSTYRVGETPVYTATGGPNATIKWTTVVNGAVTENDVAAGQTTNGSGSYSGSYHSWQAVHIGQVAKIARIGGRLADIALTVQPAVPQRRASADFNGDGRSDISVWRPSTGVWWPDTGAGPTWGVSGDLALEGDFDGDGRADPAVWRPSDATWHLLQSRDGIRIEGFGVPSDKPVPADFDGDGRTDIAVYRPSDHVWHVLGTSAGYYSLQFGADGDRPVPSDFDGDGHADIAVYRAGTWIILQSSDGQTVAEQFGLPTDRTVPGDYDGDGRTDLAVFRPSESMWYVRQSSNGAWRTEYWGLSTDTPAPGDFDGDGKQDFAVFRPAKGGWYVRYFAGGELYGGWGRLGDVAIPGVNYTR